MQPGTVRTPGLGMLLNGQTLPGVISAEVQSNNHYQADTWKAELALNVPGGQGIAQWDCDALVGQLFTVRMGLDSDIRAMIVGEADQVDVEPIQGTVSLSGRDLTARLIEAKTQTDYLNQTASEVATALANEHGLTPVVTTTTTPISRFYSGNHDQVSHHEHSKSGTEWDLLTRLAGFEGYDVWVSGTELHFAPAIDISTADLWAMNPQLAISMKLGRSLTHAKGVVVQVKVHNSSLGRDFTKTSGGGSGKSSKTQPFVFLRPNLTEDQAQKLADSLQTEISKHERTVRFEVPGELDMTARDAVSLTGVGQWSQSYYVSSVSRKISMGAGFTQSVVAKNQSPQAQVSTT